MSWRNLLASIFGDFCEGSSLPDCLERSELTIDLARWLTERSFNVRKRYGDSTCSDIKPVIRRKHKVFDDLRQQFRQLGLKTSGVS